MEVIGLPVMRSLSPSTIFGEDCFFDSKETIPTKSSKRSAESSDNMDDNIERSNKIRRNTIGDKPTSVKKRIKSPEEIALIDSLWKQDVDIGIPREAFDDDTDLEKTCLDKYEDFLEIDVTKDKDPDKEPEGTFLEKLHEDKNWPAFNFTIDSETGELLANDSVADEATGAALNVNDAPSLELQVDNVNPFDLVFNLDEALRLVELPAEDTDLQTNLKDTNDGGTSPESGFSEGSESPSTDLDSLSTSIDEMLQTTQFSSRNVQGRLGGLVRGGSMDQRWQDLASLLSLPSPDAHHAQSPPTSSMAAHGTSPIHTHPHPTVHHPHPLYPPHDTPPTRGVLLHNSTLPPTMPEHAAHNITYSNSMGASSHLVTSSMNLTNNADLNVPATDHSYKMENSSMNSDMLYYQQQAPPTQAQNSNPQELTQPSDGIWSSILEDDLQLMDMTMSDYNGRNASEYSGNNYRYSGQEDPHRHPQKKHHLFGKRYFQESSNGPSSNLVSNNAPIPVASAVPLGYAPHYQSSGVSPMEGATALDPSELKYSCTMDFRSPDVGSAGALDHVQHNHTYHMSPEGPSGMSRPLTKDKKGKKSDSEKNLSRDEKKARSLNLPITCDEIINLPMDEFNERISKFDLTEAQLSLIRDIRRRGKNKVAAQNCRKRKLDQITYLAEEVKAYQCRKSELRNQLEHYTAERARIKHKFSLLYRHIFNSLRDPDGNPYCPHEFSLQQSADGDILLVPRSAAPHPSMARKEEPSP